MEITIEQVRSDASEAAISRIREQVFEREMGIHLARMTEHDSAKSLHLLARIASEGDTVAALTVVDTSSDRELHERYGLDFPAGARAARYTQLAVLKPYRGLSIPLMLVLEAHRRFVSPGQFDFTWLLFDADRAASSLMSKWLAFTPGERTFMSEYGFSRALVRDERAPQAEQTIRQTEQYVEQRLKALSPAGRLLANRSKA